MLEAQQPADTAETPIESRLYAALDALHVEYVRQKEFTPYVVDAWLPVWHVALEADGCFVHQSCRLCGTWNRRAVMRLAARDRDLARRDHRLPVLHIRGHALYDDQQARQSVRAALARLAMPEPWESFDTGDVWFTDYELPRPTRTRERETPDE